MSGLDGAIGEFESIWVMIGGDTVVLIATEFGRTARINGTDHRIGTIALFAGGDVNGGWTGDFSLAWVERGQSLRYEGRDLAPTTDLRAALKGILRDHLGIGETILTRDVFPDSAQVEPMKDLIVFGSAFNTAFSTKTTYFAAWSAIFAACESVHGCHSRWRIR